MVFFSSILCGDSSTAAITPTCINDINTITVAKAYFDDIYITYDVEYEMTDEIPTTWNYNTIFHARFDGNFTAGNVNFKFSDIQGSYFLIKRRIANTYYWISLHNYLVNDFDDLNKTFVDYTAAPGTEYEYAVVPILDNVEGDYYTATITPETEKLVVVDSSALWATIVTDGFANSQRNSNPGTVETMNNKYPTIIQNGAANYDTVSITAGWFPSDEEDECKLLIGEEYDTWVSRYAKRFMDFLTNRKVKMLKNVDGRMWLCYVTTLPSNNARNIYYDREITFGVTEVGDVEDEKVLYDANLISAEERWWCH